MNKKEIGFFLTLLVVSLFLTFKIHHGKGQYNFRSEIWADRAGYYIYLPALFIYHFDAKNCPEKIDERTGYGFVIDQKNNTINTKYNYGVAALVSPFFLVAYVMSPILNVADEGGFGLLYHKVINVAAVIYLILGLWFLKRFLSFYFTSALQYVILFFIYTGTNLLFYTVDNTLMSHVYSFFLFSVFLVMLKKFLTDKSDYRSFLWMSLTYALILLIRPTNALLLILFFLWDAVSLAGVGERIRIFFKPKYLISFCAVIFLVFIPQMFYWKYSRGGFLAYTYDSETFSNWNHPKLLEIWFATLNGLFLYTPIALIMILGMIWMIVKRIPNGLLTLFLFFLISYIFASWVRWYFGCSFGQRSYVEYYAIFAIPFGYVLRDSLRIRSLLVKIPAVILLVCFSYYNGMMMLKFDQCFFGSTWDWVQFGKQLERAHIIPLSNNNPSFENDMENRALPYPCTISDSVFVSGMYAARITHDKEYTDIYTVPLSEFGDRPPRKIRVTFWALNPGTGMNEALAVCSIDKKDINILLQSQPLAPVFTQKKRWQQINLCFVLPEKLGHDPVINVYFWNPKGSTFFVDDLKVVFD
jgi:hypothetical protein